MCVGAGAAGGGRRGGGGEGGGVLVVVVGIVFFDHGSLVCGLLGLCVCVCMYVKVCEGIGRKN